MSQTLENKIIKINNDTIKRVETKSTSVNLICINAYLFNFIKNEDNVNYGMEYIKENRPYRLIQYKRFTNK